MPYNLLTIRKLFDSIEQTLIKIKIFIHFMIGYTTAQ